MSLVLVVGQFVRLFVSGLSYKIMYEQLPYVDRVLRLCLNIYLVRESRYYKMEEELFAKLIFLYRSPETMIKLTKPKQDWSLTNCNTVADGMCRDTWHFHSINIIDL